MINLLLALSIGLGLPQAMAAGDFPGGAAVEVERQLLMMGTEARITVSAVDRASALAASEAAIAALVATEERLSTWRQDSELSRFNRAMADETQRVSATLEADLEGARWCFEATGGAFDPTIGALVAAWGLRDGGRRPGATEIALARQATGMDRVAVGQGQARRPAGLMIEEGGFGKGAGLAAARRTLEADPRVIEAVIDLGGQMALSGNGTAWTVAVAAPGDRSLPVVEITVDGGSVATSGNSERGIEVDGQHLGHLLDPRSGQPTADFGSVTVWTDDPLHADCLSTGLYVLGPDAALTWAAERPGVEVLIVQEVAADRFRARATRGLRGRIRPLVEGVAITTSSPSTAVSQEGSLASPE